MAEHIHKTYSCDRCKTDLGTTRPRHGQSTRVTARFDYSEGPGPNYDWTDLCVSCRKIVMEFFGVK